MHFHFETATFFGTMILTNLMIALMTTEYDKVQKQAKAEVIFNETELTVDLSQRSRLMPPPLNVFVLGIAAVIAVLNVVVAVLCKLCRKNVNIFALIDHELFENLKEHNFNFRKWERREEIPAWRYEYVEEMWLFYTKRFCKCFRSRSSAKVQQRDLNVQPKNQWNILHKGCYGTFLSLCHVPRLLSLSLEYMQNVFLFV